MKLDICQLLDILSTFFCKFYLLLLTFEAFGNKLNQYVGLKGLFFTAKRGEKLINVS